jgi:acid phosphatase (class A)
LTRGQVTSALAALLALGAPVAAAPQAQPSAKPQEQQPIKAPGYLGPQGVPEAVKFLPPPPADNSLSEQRDFAVFMETRKLKGSDRWALATSDAQGKPQLILDDWSCALGASIDAKQAPALTKLMVNVGRDAGAIVDRIKDHYKRPRPFVGNAQPICVERTADLAKSPSYPSGHTTFSWAWGLVLAEIAPDRADQVLARARAYGESRVVCGVHFVSDIDQGRADGSALIAAEHASPAFRADLDAARLELAALRKTAPAPSAASCRVPDEAAAHTPWTP